jgi:hypothetical protein
MNALAVAMWASASGQSGCGGQRGQGRHVFGRQKAAQVECPMRLGQACVLQHQVDQHVAQEPCASCGDDVLAPPQRHRQQAQDAEELVD